MDYGKQRIVFLNWIKKQLIGPAMDGNLLGITPIERYPVGTLFPVINLDEGIDPVFELNEDEEESDSASDIDNTD